MLLLGLLAAVALVVQGQDPCASAPTPAAKVICRQLHKWDEAARKKAAKKTLVALPPGIAAGKNAIAAELAPIASSIYQCMDLQCMCTYLRGNLAPNGACTLPNGQPLRKAIRKELRMMSDDERERFNQAVRTLKQNGEFDRISRIHAQSTRVGGAHSGPAFLPWHREFSKRFEFALRQVDPSLALPYWDSTLESALPRPADSAMFSAALMGDTNAQGLVDNGPFAGFRTLEGLPHVKRAVGKEGAPFKQGDIDFVMRQNQVDQVLAFSAPRQGCPYRTDYNCLEYTHGNGHLFVGGDMYDTATSANDPLFYPHHSFVDFIWEQWRQQRQTRADRETLYPPDNQLCASPQHFAAANMNPFTPMRNIDGLSNKYTDNLYEYAARPFCTRALPNCGSKFLFCDLSHGQPRCAAKMKVGGNCGTFVMGEDSCYMGSCMGGRCVATTAIVVTPPPRPIPTVAPVVVAPQETCFNENQCCGTWAAHGECTRNVDYMDEWCKASCGHCRPQYRLVDDCSDRHKNCRTWSSSGECNRNALWMTENCRMSCNKCGTTRAFECGGETAVATTTAHPQQPQCEASDGCYNENVCCAYWSLLGECRKSPAWMACNCRVSCGHCVPLDYGYGSCLDYHRDCAGWARQGECEKNPWMSENCRASCRTCYSQFDLRSMCRGPVGSVAPVATARPRQPTVTQPPPRWQQGGFRFGGVDYDDNWGGMGGGLMSWGTGGGGGIANGWGGPMPLWQRSWFKRARARRSKND
ncbi:hypothetical protein V3C99_005520 [Haemonchus contortus]